MPQPYAVEKKIPYKVEVPVDRPYPVKVNHSNSFFLFLSFIPSILFHKILRSLFHNLMKLLSTFLMKSRFVYYLNIKCIIYNSNNICFILKVPRPYPVEVVKKVIYNEIQLKMSCNIYAMFILFLLLKRFHMKSVLKCQ